MSSSTKLDTTTIVLVLLAVIVLLPLLAMGMGFGGMMGYGMMGGYGGSGGAGGWWPLAGLFAQLAFLVVLLGGGYLLFRRVSEQATGSDPAMEELRLAYARGDLTDEEFEERREKLLNRSS